MKRYILTGTPGCGKTTLIRAFQQRGFPVVEEAATDVIAREHARGNDEPWRDPSFIERIAALQEQRLTPPVQAAAIQFHDRSLICTHALSTYLGYPIPASLTDAIAAHLSAGTFENDVFFIENLGRVEPTEARRITFEESLVFEQIHRETYERFGFRCVTIARAPVDARSAMVLAHLS